MSTDQWAEFDPNSYAAANYSVAREEDIHLARWTAEAFHSEPSGLDVLDIGTGSNLYPIICAAPRAANIVACEFGQKNIEWLARQLSRAELDEMWMPFVDAVSGVFGKDEMFSRPGIHNRLRQIVHVRQGSIFQLPERAYDASTMFFCAESITDEVAVFEDACRRWARAVNVGGRLVGAFMERSLGYQVADIQFPALAIEESQLRSVFSDIADIEEVRRIPVGSEPIRDGYTGILFFRGRAKS